MSLIGFSAERSFSFINRKRLIILFLGLVILASQKSTAIIFNDNARLLIADRQLPFSDDDFTGVGQIQCRSNGFALDYLATGWVAGASDTVVTAAHSFYPVNSGDARGGAVLSPDHCVFALYDQNQNLREIAAIRYAISPWALDRHRNDSSYDFAIVKLSRPVTGKPVPLAVVPAANFSAATQLIAMDNFTGALPQPRLSQGETFPFPQSQVRYDRSGISITRARRLFASSASSMVGASGGMYYDVRRGAAFGIHIGFLCDQSGPVFGFDAENCFNYGLRFDSAMVAIVNAIASDRLVPSDLLIADPGRRRRAARDQRSSYAVNLGADEIPPLVPR